MMKPITHIAISRSSPAPVRPKAIYARVVSAAGPVMDKKILVLDWDTVIHPKLLSGLITAGCHVFRASQRADGLRQIIANELALAILGIRGDGDREWEMCWVIRDLSSMPLVVITSRNEPALCVRALEYGADDCVHNGCSAEELAARVQVLLRRTAQVVPIQSKGYVRAGDLGVDLVGHQVTVNGQPVLLSAVEYRLLLCFLDNGGSVLTTEDLVGLVWGPAARRRPDYPRMYVRSLRCKLGDHAANPKYIQNIHGVGYRWTVPVTRAASR
jgi:DNA-binding response OmpR family regulator